MPRGDGTGPLGTGPLGRKSGSGKRQGLGRRMNRDCAVEDTGERIGRIISSGSPLKISTLLMSMFSVAIPALMKVRAILTEKKVEKLLDTSAEDSKTITIKAERVETVADKDLTQQR